MKLIARAHVSTSSANQGVDAAPLAPIAYGLLTQLLSDLGYDGRHDHAVRSYGGTVFRMTETRNDL